MDTAPHASVSMGNGGGGGRRGHSDAMFPAQVVKPVKEKAVSEVCWGVGSESVSARVAAALRRLAFLILLKYLVTHWTGVGGRSEEG